MAPDEPSDPPTLQEIARRTPYVPGWPLEETTVTAGLAKAGIDPADEKERERFRRLVIASSHTRQADEAGRLGKHYDRAAEALGPDADPEEVLGCAREAFEYEQEMIREMMEEND